MSMSGVKIDPNCVDAYLRVKNNKTKCCVFKISDDMKQIEIVPESELKFKRGQQDPEQFKQFKGMFPDDNCRYAVYHAIICLEGSDGIKAERDRIVFCSWAPDTAKIKAKMLHSSSKDAIKKAFEGIGIEFQFSSQEDLTSKEWIDKFQDLPNIKLAGKLIEFEGAKCEEWDDIE